MPRATPLLLALLLAPATLAQVGSYQVEGVAGVDSYRGQAMVSRRPDGELRLLVWRSDGTRSRGTLVPEAASVAPAVSAWRYEAPLAGTGGLAGAVAGEPLPERALQARWLRVGTHLFGAWRVVEGERVVASGRETLRPRQAWNAPRGRLRLAISVDWEGRDLRAENLAAMAALREALPGVPLTHFLNAAYYTKPGADAARITSQIAGAVLPGDEAGLHVHGWRSLFAAAGVAFRERPSFWGEGWPLQPSANDLGHEVEIGAYEVDELRAVLRLSRERLGAAGFPIGASFRAGGWMATPPVLEAIRAEGFLVDSSATDSKWHDELQGMALHARIPEVWPGVTERSQPFAIETPAGRVLEMPDTGALADYVTAAEMVAHLRAAAERLAADPGRDLFVHIGFHQETAARYAPRVTEAVRTLAAERELPLVIETLAESAAAAARE